ncbi:aminopeptidase P N-terminal domain-containing protein [Iodobacter sp. CM08]|uniref:aminopeptidase P N-terminal domain-containing protein n=1 Tax=Iodobacter sp. CM08 TaxID=3085902 RepID=UPI0029816BF9|nr:aminopeptidase P N-terminal domain-containing protein [Iodobacter sp. CM08]MDW5417769.1 aminopeptidase P N-terminal domain-containing protein [Iodobacter sp. CM08]
MQPFVARRSTLSTRLAAGVLVVPNTTEIIRNADTTYPFRYDSSFYYLTGFNEPDAVFVQINQAGSTQNILFCRPKDLEREIWDGHRYGPEEACKAFGFDAAYSIEELDNKMIELLQNQPRIHTTFGHNPTWDSQVSRWVNGVRAKVRSGVTAPNEIHDVRGTIAEMRLFKDKFELVHLRKAGLINSAAHARAMRFARPGQMEYEVEAEILHDYYRQGSRFPAYSSIVAAGANATCLHYGENNKPLQDGDLILIDAGCEIEGYASDITRTFPVNGKYSGPQKDVYEITLAAQYAALDACRVGQSWNAPHEAAVRVLTQGMLDLGLLQGSLDGAIESLSYKQFYMHNTGHWMGLDVHDAGAYKIQGEWRKLEAGMVMTVEPGFYIRPAANVPTHFENIGVRIEDDVLITPNGMENLTESCPKTVAEIEAVMAR